MLCEEERLKKELKTLKLRFMEEADGDSLLPDSVTCDADREKYNNLVKKLNYIEVVKKELNVT